MKQNLTGHEFSVAVYKNGIKSTPDMYFVPTAQDQELLKEMYKRRFNIDDTPTEGDIASD